MTRHLLVLVAVFVLACTPSAAPQVTPSPTSAPKVVLRVLVTRAVVGTPVTGAHVCASKAAGPETCADTGKDGAAAIQGMPGTYFVRVNGPSEQRWQAEQRVTDMASGDAALWIELTQLHRISGRIRDDAGATVAGANACAHPTKPDDPLICAKSGADGVYTIDAKPDVYRLEVSGASGQRLVSQWARGRAFLEEADVLDARTVDVPDVDVTLVHGVVLKGVVTFAGQPVEDAQVCIRTLAAPLPWACERTDKKGAYAALREPGQYYVWTVPPGTIAAVPQWYDRALTGVGASVVALVRDQTINVALTGGPTLRGTLRDPSGQVVQGALVCVDTAFTTGRICRETDGNGRYQITTRPETYIISVYPPAHSGLIAGYWNDKRTWIDADDVAVNSDRTLDLVVQKGVIVTGTVKDTRGIPVPGATVNFNDGSLYAAASTDTDSAGHFEVAVKPGTFGLEVFPPFAVNLVGATQTVSVRAAMDLQVTLPDITP